MRNPILAPDREGKIIDHACESDRIYFETHPEKRERLRLSIPGEFWPLEYPDNTWVRVYFVEPGLRIRELIPAGGSCGHSGGQGLTSDLNLPPQAEN